jgi:hypothetical protein
MVREMVMAPHPPSLATGQRRVLARTVVSGSRPSPWPHTPLAQGACGIGESSDVALAVAASVGWCEVEPSAAPDLASAPVEPGERARTADGGRARLVTCGLWLARRRLVAAVVDPGGEAHRVVRAALTDDARFGLIEYLAAAGAEIVATEALARIDLMPVQAARRGLAVWTVGDALIAALLRAAAIREPARAAALLARLPVIPLMRSWIHRLASPDGRQLPLL